MTEYVKILDNDLLQKYDVKLYGSNYTTCDIIDDFLGQSQGEDPFYIVDLGEIISSYNKWITLLPTVKPHYAVKCNSNPAILETLASVGCNFDAASMAELKMVMDITKDPSRIIFAHPCKMSSQIKYARANDVDLMTFDSEFELFKVKLYHPYAKLILRLAVDDSQSVCKFNKKFGCTLSQVSELLTVAKTLKLNVVGFSFHVGSNCGSTESYYGAIKDCKNASDIAKEMGIKISVINLGGGYSNTNAKVKFEDVATRINEAMDEFFAEEIKNESVKFMAEPGRFFAENSHILVLNVIGKKIISDENEEKVIIYYLNDGVYGSFNCIHYDFARITILPFNERDEKQYYRSILYGPTCDSVDIISENVMLPELTIGESLFVESFGAYTCAASSSFNGFKTTIYKYIYRS
jgi:ornithine decarboxylase